MKRSLRNRSGLSRLRTLQKGSLTGQKSDAAKVGELISAIDKAAKRGIIHRNAARRRKARLQKQMAAAGRK
jgi:small subunit ribosomal protein S20